MSSTQVIFLGAAFVLAFDTIAALLSRAVDISYVRFTVGSWIIYALVGYFATKFARVLTGFKLRYSRAFFSA